MKKELKKVIRTARGVIAKTEGPTHHFQLIKGSFDPAEAADVLLSFINDKIKFHMVKKLSAKDDHPSSINSTNHRIEELRTAKKEITDLVLAARKTGQTLAIESTIQITMKKRGQTR